MLELQVAAKRSRQAELYNVLYNWKVSAPA
jgi:hypothetical protein